jgi:hypothetical protein
LTTHDAEQKGAAASETISKAAQIKTLFMMPF